MTKKLHKTDDYEINHTTYGGIISSYDFGRHCTLKNIADKVMADLQFDRQCRRNTELRGNINPNKT